MSIEIYEHVLQSLCVLQPPSTNFCIYDSFINAKIRGWWLKNTKTLEISRSKFNTFSLGTVMQTNLNTLLLQHQQRTPSARCSFATLSIYNNENKEKPIKCFSLSKEQCKGKDQWWTKILLQEVGVCQVERSLTI